MIKLVQFILVSVFIIPFSGCIPKSSLKSLQWEPVEFSIPLKSVKDKE